MSRKTSRISGFYKLPIDTRQDFVKSFSELNEEDIRVIKKEGGLPVHLADKMIENVIGTMEVPLGVVVNLRINNKDYLVPMAIEEPSVVAAASNMARITRENGGIEASADESIMIGQVHLAEVKNLASAKERIMKKKKELLRIAESQDPALVEHGGGPRDLQVRIVEHEDGERFLVVHLLVDCADAMGANIVNTMVESIAPLLEEISGGRAYLKIVSNLAVHRLARAKVKIKPEKIGGREVVDAIVTASKMAEADIFRACTHNKGIMNGISAIALATGNDTRAIEAGVHAYAAFDGRYRPLARWRKDEDGNLIGNIELPIAVGIVGGATRVHPIARANLRIMGVESARELAQIMAAVGLIQNLAAIRAIVTEGIQRGHMELHARNLAMMAGADASLADKIAEKAVERARREGRKITLELVRELVEKSGEE